MDPKVKALKAVASALHAFSGGELVAGTAVQADEIIRVRITLARSLSLSERQMLERQIGSMLTELGLAPLQDCRIRGGSADERMVLEFDVERHRS